MAEWANVGMTKHLMLGQLQSIDPSLGLSVAPRRSEGSVHGAAIPRQSGRERFHDARAGCTGLGKPHPRIGAKRRHICVVAGVAQADERGEMAGGFSDGCGVSLGRRHRRTA